jgi:nitrogen-specific signal transduction histidine kinase
VISAIRDMTEKKKMEAQLLRTQRLESIGTLAGGIAHDLNNVLAPIMMSIDILRLKYSNAEAERILATIESSAQRGAGMVKQILTFARGIQGERVTLQIEHLIKEVTKILKQTFPKTIEVRTTLEGKLWPLVADATQLHQVLMNLCINARDAMPNGGTLTLHAANFLVDETFAAMNSEAKVGPFVVVRVTDTGTGIPIHIRERIFDPFFTTKSLEKGTGLGLSTVRGIVKSHGGFVSVYSEMGKGTEFRVFLSAQQSATTELLQVEQRALPVGNGELVLVVDDEAAILDIAKQTLQMSGYQVLTARDGAEAVALCVQHPGEIKLMLTDMMMPIMNGPATIRAIRRIDPRIKIIAASGLGSTLKATDPKELQIEAFLQKPYTADRLVKTIHALLT